MGSMMTCFGVLLFLSAGTVSGQGQNQAPAPPATETVATNIPGVIAGGTKVVVIKEGFRGTEGPIGLPDGTLIFTETAASRITKIDKDGNTLAVVGWEQAQALWAHQTGQR